MVAEVVEEEGRSVRLELGYLFIKQKEVGGASQTKLARLGKGFVLLTRQQSNAQYSTLFNPGVVTRKTANCL